MSILNKIFGSSDPITPADGFCPNCWGRQEYQDQIIEAAEKQNVDLKNIDQKKGWIQAYAEKNLTGLKLESGSCPVCSA